MPELTEFDKIKKAIDDAWTLQVIWQGKQRDAELRHHEGRVQVETADQVKEKALGAALRVYDASVAKATLIYSGVAEEANSINEAAVQAAADARQALEDYQSKVREQHGAVIDFLAVPNSGGRTRI